MQSEKGRIKIVAPKTGAMNEADRQEIGRLLLKAGFAVKIYTKKQGNMTVGVVEFWKED